MNKETKEVREFACRVCGNIEGNQVYSVKEMMFGLREKFDYFECAQCHCLQICEFPDDMSKYYPQNYYSYNLREGSEFKGISGAFQKFQYSNSLFGSRIYEATVGKLLDRSFFHLFKRIKLQKKARVLDVGCGDGRSFLFPLAEMGFENLLGCDPFLPEELSYGNRLKIKKDGVGDMQGTWDLITYHHSYEHVPDPMEHMVAIERLLAHDGTCMIRIPVAASYAWKHYGVNWAQLDAPRHFFLHTENSIRIMAEKANLEVFDVVFDSGHFQFSGSELYQQNIALNEYKDRNLLEKLRRKNRKNRYKKMAKKLNREHRGDQAVFYIRPGGRVPTILATKDMSY